MEIKMPLTIRVDNLPSKKTSLVDVGFSELTLYENHFSWRQEAVVDEPKEDDEYVRQERLVDTILIVKKERISGIRYYYSDTHDQYAVAIISYGLSGDEDPVIWFEEKEKAQKVFYQILEWSKII